MSSPPDASAITPRPPPVRKTYGKKRVLMGPEELAEEEVKLPAKKIRVTASPAKGDYRPGSRAPVLQQKAPSNAPSRQLNPPPSLAPWAQLSSPTKLVRRGIQDQNALDSPFLEPRKPSSSPGFGLGLGPRRLSSSMKLKSSSMRLGPNTRSRHLSLNHPGSKNKARAAKETSAETLRRKTSEATTVLSTTLTEHSRLVRPPPRPSKPKFKPAGLDEPGFDFSFDPPAESTIAHVRRPVRTPPQSAAGTAQDPLLAPGSDDTPIARRPTLQDELAAASRPRKNKERHWKQHDSILSTDSEDPGTSISIFGLTPKPRPMNAPPEDPDATPRNQPSLIQQFCEPRPRSGSVTVRALSNDIRSSAPPSLSSGDADDEMADSPLVRQDSSVRALTEACADIDLDGDSSPSRLIKAASRQTKGQRKIEVNKPSPPLASSPTVQRTRFSEKPYQLSPRAVHRLSQRRRVGMRIEDRPLSPNDDVDMFASYEFDRGAVMDTDN